ncbi:MAG: GNAT family N-acetyltransferase [Marmoricola sp.]
MNTDRPGSIEIQHVPGGDRYELRDGDRVIGRLDYSRPDDEHIDVLHTEVDQEYGGQGLAGRLVAHVLADVRARGLRVIPHCPYVQEWLRRNTGYQDLVDWPRDHA